MWFSIGIAEIGLAICGIAATLICAVMRRPAWRWLAVASASLAAAAVITPADPFSTIVLAGILLGFFWAGVLFQRRSVPAL